MRWGYGNQEIAIASHENLFPPASFSSIKISFLISSLTSDRDSIRTDLSSFQSVTLSNRKKQHFEDQEDNLEKLLNFFFFFTPKIDDIL